MTGPTIVDTNAMPWVRGRQAAGLAGGDGSAARADESEYDRRYEVKTFLFDERTGQRGFRARAVGGHAISARYHHSCEESFIVDGRNDLRSEGEFTPGSYFWRPAGWVHASSLTDGWEAITYSIGEDPSEASGRHSDVLCDEAEEGRNPLYPDRESAIGPRGWIRNLDSSLVAWESGGAFVRRQGGVARAGDAGFSVRTLSANVDTGAQTSLTRLAEEFARPQATYRTGVQFTVLEGEVELGGETLPAGCFVHARIGEPLPPLSSGGGATLLFKSDAWLQEAS